MFVTDTHPLLWFANNKFSKLSAKVLEVFQKAERNESLIYIPAVVFWEIAILENLGKIKLTDRFDRWADILLSQNNFEIIHLEIPTIARSVGYNFNNDVFDKIIVSSAVELDLPLITKDFAVTNSNLVETYW